MALFGQNYFYNYIIAYYLTGKSFCETFLLSYLKIIYIWWKEFTFSNYTSLWLLSGVIRCDNSTVYQRSNKPSKGVFPSKRTPECPCPLLELSPLPPARDQPALVSSSHGLSSCQGGDWLGTMNRSDPWKEIQLWGCLFQDKVYKLSFMNIDAHLGFSCIFLATFISWTISVLPHFLNTFPNRFADTVFPALQCGWGVRTWQSAQDARNCH